MNSICWSPVCGITCIVPRTVPRVQSHVYFGPLCGILCVVPRALYRLVMYCLAYHSADSYTCFTHWGLRWSGATYSMGSHQAQCHVHYGPTLSMVPRAAWAHVKYDATYSMGPSQAWYLLLTTYHAGHLPRLFAFSGMHFFLSLSVRFVMTLFTIQAIAW